ncbi:MAG TPA: phage virion morphogenesis protein [Polyangiaceae bacterium]|nr:phage virion morphogenesis protein [Polyangiaceae bacterium]
MTAGFSVESKFDDKVSRGLRTLANNVRTLGPALDEIGAMLVTSTQIRLDQQKSPDGTPFAPLAARTLARKQRLRKPLIILQENRYLYESVAHQVIANHTTKVGVSRIQGRRLHLGDEGGKPMPARPYLGLSDDDVKEIENILTEHAQRGVE